MQRDSIVQRALGRATLRSVLLSAITLLVFAGLMTACDGVGNDFEGAITDVSIEFAQGAVAIVGEPVTVEAFVTDNFGVAVPGATVRWSVGEGTLAAATSETNASGIATGEWTLGTTAAEQEITVQVEGAGNVSSSAAVAVSTGPVGGISAALAQDSVQVGRTTLLRVTRIEDIYGNEVPPVDYSRYGVNFFSLDTLVARIVPPPAGEDGEVRGVEGVAEGEVLLAVTAAAVPPGRSGFRLGEGAAADTLSLSVLSFVSGGPFAAAVISAGEGFTCGVDTEGAVYCWGANATGQLGVGDFEPRLLPARVNLPGPAASVSAGGSHACALLQSSEVYCWGEAIRGRLGNGVDGDELFPEPVLAQIPSSAGTIVEVRAGEASTCALTADGDIYCWGSDSTGRIGNGAPPEPTEDGTPDIRVNTPALVNAPASVRFTALGSIAEHTCAVAEGGAAYCWGRSAPEFRLGNGFSTIQLSPEPVQVQPTNVAFSAVAAHAIASSGLGEGGQLYGWGFGDTKFPTGSGLMEQVFQATPVEPSESYVSLAGGGGTHACALTVTGAASCWGDNLRGQLGTGTTESSFIPIPVTTELRFESIDVGSFFQSCAVVEGGGEAYCWGSNEFGQVGIGNTEKAVLLPTRVETEAEGAPRSPSASQALAHRRAWCAAISDRLRRSTGVCGTRWR